MEIFVLCENCRSVLLMQGQFPVRSARTRERGYQSFNVVHARRVIDYTLVKHTEV